MSGSAGSASGGSGSDRSDGYPGGGSPGNTFVRRNFSVFRNIVNRNVSVHLHEAPTARLSSSDEGEYGEGLVPALRFLSGDKAGGGYGEDFAELVEAVKLLKSEMETQKYQSDYNSEVIHELEDKLKESLEDLMKMKDKGGEVFDEEASAPGPHEEDEIIDSRIKTLFDDDRRLEGMRSGNLFM